MYPRRLRFNVHTQHDLVKVAYITPTSNDQFYTVSIIDLDTGYSKDCDLELPTLDECLTCIAVKIDSYPSELYLQTAYQASVPGITLDQIKLYQD